MKKNYYKALHEVFSHEGGYVDHPKDPGGATNMGITRRTLAVWRGFGKKYGRLPKSEVRNLSKQEAAQIYRKNYWNMVKGDQLPSGVDLAVFDFAVNSGVSRASKFIQRLVKVKADGVIGSITLKAINNHSPEKLVKQLIAKRLAFLKRLSIWETFGRGWQRRVDSVELASLALIGVKQTKPEHNPNPNNGSHMTKSLFEIIVNLIKKIFGRK